MLVLWWSLGEAHVTAQHAGQVHCPSLQLLVPSFLLPSANLGAYLAIPSELGLR